MKTPSLLPALQGLAVILLFTQLGNHLLPISPKQDRTLKPVPELVTGQPACLLTQWSRSAALALYRMAPPAPESPCRRRAATGVTPHTSAAAE